MSIDTAGSEASARVDVRPRNRTRRIVLGVVLVALLAVLASMLTYRQTVRSERQSTYDAVSQSQIQQAYEVMQAVAYDRMSADDARAQVELDLAYSLTPGRSLTVDVPRSRLGGGNPMMQLDIESTNLDLPWWTGQPYLFMSVLLEGTYISNESGASIDESACTIRMGSPYEPVLTETVPLGNGYLATPCSAATLARYGIG